MFFAVANDERICVCVGLDFPLQRKNTTRFQSAELQRIFESTGGSSRWIEKITRWSFTFCVLRLVSLGLSIQGVWDGWATYLASGRREHARNWRRKHSGDDKHVRQLDQLHAPSAVTIKISTFCQRGVFVRQNCRNYIHYFPTQHLQVSCYNGSEVCSLWVTEDTSYTIQTHFNLNKVQSDFESLH